LGDILVALGLLTPEQVIAAQEEATLLKELIGQCLLRRKLITPQELRAALAYQSGLPAVDLPDPRIPLAAHYVRLLPTMIRFDLVPFEDTDRALLAAVKRPPSPLRVGEIERMFGKRLRFFLASDEQIAAVLAWLGATPAPKQGDLRYKTMLAIWLRTCGPHAEPLGQNHGGWILGLSPYGLTIEAPDAFLVEVRKLHSNEPRLLVQFSTPPLDVSAVCVVRHVKKRETTQLWENPWLLDLEFKEMGAAEREHLLLLYRRAEVAQQLLQIEFGIDGTSSFS
jgi:hypothetical protein